MKPVSVGFNELLKEIPWAAIKEYSPTAVVGISRGGIVLASILAHRLGAELVPVSASFYDDAKPANKLFAAPKFSGALPNLSGKKVLIVDDVSNTGKTISLVLKEVLAKTPLAAKTFVYAGSADFSCREFTMCLKFPWEE